MIFQGDKIKEFITGKKAEQKQVNNGDLIAILLYDKNLYNELESVFLTDEGTSIKTLSTTDKPILKSVEEELLKVGFSLTQDELKRRLIEISFQKINDKKIFPILVDVSSFKRNELKIKEIDVVSLDKQKMSEDLITNFLLAMLLFNA
jgi:hypothetical protein